MKRYNKKLKAFTIVELLITVFIFSAVMIIASSSLSIGFMTGRLHSTSSQEANRSMNLFFDILGQKMATANSRFGTHYGFGIINPGNPDLETLVIVSKGTAGGADQCVYIGKRGTAVKMTQEDCINKTPTLDHAITSDTIKVTGFELNPDGNTYEYDTTDKLAPYLTVKITMEDTKTGVKESAQSSYNIPYLTYSQWSL